MGFVELALAMLLAVVASGYLARIVPIPLPLVQIVLGGLIAGVLHHGVVLQPEVFFLLFLPPLLFLDGWRIPKDGLLRDRRPILQLAFGLVIFTVLGAGYLIHWLIPGMPLAVAFALAAIVSPTDPVAVSAIAAHAPVPRRMMHILEGESLLNDASGLVCFQFAVAAALTGAFTLGRAFGTLLWVALAGFACGVVFTLLVTWVQRRVTRRFGEVSGAPILVNLLIPFGAYLLAESIHASGILAAVAAGITMSYVEWGGRGMATTRLERTAVWNTLQFALNGSMFVLLGEQFPRIVGAAVGEFRAHGHHDAWLLLVYALAITVGLAALRYAWVWVSLRVYAARRRNAADPIRRTDWRVILATSLAGVRGAITLAGVLTLPLLLPDGRLFPARNLAIFLAAAVILISLLAGSIGLPPLLRSLHFSGDAGLQQEEERVRVAAATAAIEATRKAYHSLRERAPEADQALYAKAATRVIAFYERRARPTGGEAVDADELRKSDAIERELRLVALAAERSHITSLALRNRVPGEISTRLLRDLDLLEALYR